MTLRITIPDFSVVMLLSRKRARPAGAFANLTKCTKIIGDVNRPTPLKEHSQQALALGQSILVELPYSHAKARRDLSRAAHTYGASSIAVLIDRIDDLDPASEKHDQIIDLIGADLSDIVIERSRMPADLTNLYGPFDIIGDIHGCADELMDLLVELGHAVLTNEGPELTEHPDRRRVCLVGDLTDRGPQNLRVMQIAKQLHKKFGAIVVLGNHDAKLARWLRGRNVHVAAGLALTIKELEALNPDDREAYADWLDTLHPHYSLDSGRLVVAHAGLAEHLHGRSSGEAKSFAMYGKTNGELDEEGLPVQMDWAADYAGTATVVHGHVVTREPRILNNVVAIDTGCVFGGRLTAYRYPERDFVSIQARRTYFEKHF